MGHSLQSSSQSMPGLDVMIQDVKDKLDKKDNMIQLLVTRLPRSDPATSITLGLRQQRGNRWRPLRPATGKGASLDESGMTSVRHASPRPRRATNAQNSDMTGRNATGRNNQTRSRAV
ncbi:Hypp4000 [Branchiostoma lanceolatum]|uniref:Hypp4000 protein n=1 Tax=Branchiostoma lanceolatum TaxID=7740 RepID=A0A8K0EU26_BRALA|nr:Hypp4000 [Branchiostoma lanceolatum]